MSSADGRPPRRARRASSAPASSCSTRCFASTNFRSRTAKCRPRDFSSSMAAARRTPPSPSPGSAAAPRSPGRWADRPATTTTATACSARLTREQVDCTSCQRVDGLRHRAVGDLHQCARRPHHRDLSRRAHRRDAAGRSGRPSSPRPTRCWPTIAIPAFVQPICEAARRRGLPVVLDGDRPTVEDDPLFRLAIACDFFLGMPARDHRRQPISAKGCRRIARQTDAFLAVSNGPDDIVYLEGGTLRRLPVFKITAVDTLGAGDAFHGGFVLALAEGQNEVAAMRFGAAVAGHQMHPDWRLGRCADPGRSRGLFGRARRRRLAPALDLEYFSLDIEYSA